MKVIQVEALAKKFGGQFVLDHVNFQISRGEFVVILGSSGAGKSTLMRCLNGLLLPDSGTVRIQDTVLNKRNLRAVRRKMGFIFQNFNVVGSLSVLQNVLIGLLGEKFAWSVFFSQEEKRRAEEAIEIVGLKDKLHTRVDRLSGGQKQRVGIARVLVQRPDVILADEPVSSLDPVISREILELLKSINEQFGTVVVCNLHQLEYAESYGQRIIGIREGHIQFDGHPGQLNEEALVCIYGKRVVGSSSMGKDSPEKSIHQDVLLQTI